MARHCASRPGHVMTTAAIFMWRGFPSPHRPGEYRNRSQPMFVNACYWTMGLEAKLPEKADVTLPAGPNPFKRGVKPAEALK